MGGVKTKLPPYILRFRPGLRYVSDQFGHRLLAGLDDATEDREYWVRSRILESVPTSGVYQTREVARCITRRLAKYTFGGGDERIPAYTIERGPHPLAGPTGQAGEAR